jgi:hypothetical protein
MLVNVTSSGIYLVPALPTESCEHSRFAVGSVPWFSAANARGWKGARRNAERI